MAKTLMIQGTSSDAGKSMLVTALCRLLKNRGQRVAPFKSQNMALNSAVTADGGEIGRAQALQAKACGIPPNTDMNPVLLKPNSDCDAQVIVQGKPAFMLNAKQFHDYKQRVFPAVLESYHRLQQQHDWIIVEGAGSPAEINLRKNDIANMGFAEAVDCPVVLIADIDRGGVFAQCVGTLELLSPSERDRVKGFIINKFRGDVSLLDSGLRWLENKTNKPVFGVLPFIEELYLSAEDSVATQQRLNTKTPFKIIIPMLPRISNHTDFDPLRLHPDIDLQFINPKQKIPAADLIILPGTKNTREDLAWLRQKGWEVALKKHLRFGGKVLGICGGLQMLGQTIADPLGIEGEVGTSKGFQLLTIHTTLMRAKQLRQVRSQLTLPNQPSIPVSGYEIHAGESDLDRDTVIMMDDSQQVLGTYLHGLFDSPDACQALLKWAGCDTNQSVDIQAIENKMLDTLASTCEQFLKFDKLIECAT